MPSKKKRDYLVSGVLLLILFFILNFLISNGIISKYYSGILTLICINIILAVSLNLTVGLLGQINLGHAGFMSIGAYTAGLIMKSGLVSGIGGYLISILIGGLFAFIFGVIVGIPSLRLKGDYLAIITLAFCEIIRVLIEFFDFTGGAQGLSGIPTIKSFPLVFFIMVISVAFMYSLMTSRHGRAVLAIRDDEIAAESSGIDTTMSKVFTFAVSAMFAGIAGGMYAQYIGILKASQFGYSYSVDILVMVVLGGMGSFTGSTLSAIVLTVLPELLRTFQDYRMIIYSIVLIIIMIYRPQGILGKKEFQISKFLDTYAKRFRKKEGKKNG